MKSSWFSHPLYGSALGFAKENSALEGYVRCLLCCRDIKVASRGITTFGEHCRSERHHKLDCQWRMQRGLRLRTRSGSLMPDDEEKMQKELLAGLSVPEFEKCPDFTAMEVLSMEAAGSSVWNQVSRVGEGDVVSSRTFVCLLIDAVHRDGSSDSVASMWESLVSLNDKLIGLMGSTCTAVLVEVSMSNFRDVMYKLHFGLQFGLIDGECEM